MAKKTIRLRLRIKTEPKNLHKVLYQCPNCLTEHEMDSDKDLIWCNHCKKNLSNGYLRPIKSVRRYN